MKKKKSETRILSGSRHFLRKRIFISKKSSSVFEKLKMATQAWKKSSKWNGNSFFFLILFVDGFRLLRRFTFVFIIIVCFVCNGWLLTSYFRAKFIFFLCYLACKERALTATTNFNIWLLATWVYFYVFSIVSENSQLLGTWLSNSQILNKLTFRILFVFCFFEWMGDMI